MIRSDRNRITNSIRQGEGALTWFIAAGLVAFLITFGTAHAQVNGQPTSAATEQLYDSVNGSVCTIIAIAQDGSYVSRGSGFILQGSGLLVTNAHVLAGLQTAMAKCGGQQLDIRRIVKFDRDVDLAVGEIGPTNIPGLTLATATDIRPGSQIYVFGSPYGLEGTITPGLASGNRTIDGRSYIQVSAPISAGSSGGPVTDEHGTVLGVTVASLERGQNINFAIPASVITELPDVDMQTADLAEERSGVSTAPVVESSPTPPRRIVAAGTAAFRGNTFGSPCGDIVAAEYARKRPVERTRGRVRFDEWYAGTLEWNVELLGAPAQVYYDCDERFGLTRGYYKIRGHDDAVARIARVLRSKYGSGIGRPISEVAAKQYGCLFNYSLPGSRFYRPSEWTSWRIDDRFHVDLLECGGKSTLTFLFYSDPALLATAGERKSAPQDPRGFKESDL